MNLFLLLRLYERHLVRRYQQLVRTADAYEAEVDNKLGSSY